MLCQIFVNILTNAVKFTHEGEIKVRVDKILKQDAIHIVAKIKDTGVGIDNIDTAGQWFGNLNVVNNVN
jgi:signal transduction histidine kinase